MSRRVSCTVNEEMWRLIVERSIVEGCTVDPERPATGPVVRKALTQYLARYSASPRHADHDDGR